MNSPFTGIICPLVTPLTDPDTLDINGLEKIISHVMAGGVHGIFILGTTGEFAGLSYRTRREVITQTCKLVNGRIPVLVGIADSSFTESVNLAKVAAEAGASAVVLTPPFYYGTSQEELKGYMQRMARVLPLPLFLYNMPVHTKVEISPETVRELAKEKNIVGLKDSSANLAYMNQVRYLVKDKSDFTFMVGPEELLSEFVLSGGHGGVNGGSNMFPELYVNLYKACIDRDFDQITILRNRVQEVSQKVYSVGKFGSSYLRGLKCALSVMGLCKDTMTEPFFSFNETEKNKIREALKTLS